jgi:hypothetical protein
MNMQGMSMGGDAGSGSHGISMGHMAGGAHASVNLLPEWLGIVGAVMFLLIAGSHLGHLLMVSGERRPWHVLHALMAMGMAIMFVPSRFDPGLASAGFWQLLFVGTAAAAGLRWLIGVTGSRPANPLWLLSSIELGTMVYMWSSGSFALEATWALVTFLLVDAGLWVANAYRVVDGGTPLVGWGAMTPATDGEGAILIAGVASESLMGGLDISVSMTAMALGMAYMLVAMQVMM